MMKKLLQGLMVGSLLLVGGGIGSVSAEAPIKIGGNFELSGEGAAYGTPVKEGFEMALEEKEEQGGLLGRSIEWTLADNKSDKTEAASVASQLVSQEVSSVIGPTITGAALATFPIMTDAGIPAILPAATGDDLTLDGEGNVLEYLFRICFEDRYQGQAAAHFVHQDLGASRVAILEDADNDYSVGLAQAFKERYESLGGEIVMEESYNTGDTDFMTVLTNLMMEDFEVLYAPGYYTEVGSMIKQAREMGLDMPIVGGDGYSNETLIELAGAENTNEVYFTSHFSEMNPDEKVQNFLQAYEERSGKAADTFVALGYDATNVLLDAIERADSDDPEAIREALLATKDFQGVTGTFSFDENHNPIKPALMLKLENGQVVETIEVQAE